MIIWEMAKAVYRTFKKFFKILRGMDYVESIKPRRVLTLYDAALGPPPLTAGLAALIWVTFDDIRKEGKSIQGTEQYVELTLGDLHSGATYPAVIYFNYDGYVSYRDMIDAGLNPVFWISERKNERT